MSPTKSHLPQQTINGPRPSPLRINKESNPIRKSSSSSSVSSSMIIAPPFGRGVEQQQRQRQQKNPVIIYTHSPKIIHTQARDFMALVQKLTGFSRSNDDGNNDALARKIADGPKVSISGKGNDDIHRICTNDAKVVGIDRKESASSALTEEDGSSGDNNRGVVVNSMSQVFDPPNDPYLADIPLFIPSSTNLFCTPRTVDRYPGSLYNASPNMGNPISPSFFEFLKGFPEC